VPEVEATYLATKYQGGIVFEPENARQLCGVIEKLNSDRDLLRQFAGNCEIAAKELDRKNLSRKMFKELQGLTVSPR
jgi:hypothetical protein